MSESDYYEPNGPNPDPRPTREQFGYARDAVGLAQLLLAGYDGHATDYVLTLMQDPKSIPGVLQGMAGLISEALQEDPATPTHEFFQRIKAQLDAAEAAAG